MAKKSAYSVKRNCFDAALQLMFKYDNPSTEQIYRHMCLRNHCPEEHCTFDGGFTKGITCPYPAAVKLIIGKLKAIRDED